MAMTVLRVFTIFVCVFETQLSLKTRTFMLFHFPYVCVVEDFHPRYPNRKAGR